MNPLLYIIAGGGLLYLLTKDEGSEAEQQQQGNTQTFAETVNAGSEEFLLNPASGEGLAKIQDQARKLAANERVVEKIIDDLGLRSNIYSGTVPVRTNPNPPHWEWMTGTPLEAHYIGSFYRNRRWFDHVEDSLTRWSQLVGTKNARMAATLLEMQQYGGTGFAGGSDRLWSKWMRNDGPYGKAVSRSSNIDKKEIQFVRDAFLIMQNLKRSADAIDKALEVQALSDMQQAGIKFIN